ncbi:hypothetical protein [Planomonospora algeriensis]
MTDASPPEAEAEVPAPLEPGEAAGEGYAVTPMFDRRPVRQVELPDEHAVSIDIYEHPSAVPPHDRTRGATLSVPSRIVIDGQPVYLPKDSGITVKAGLRATEVTLTLFARRVRIGYADELDGPVGVPAGQAEPAED